uniref:Uncharacterized protein n=1 Tax=Panagrolaimus davidi TaxID=227884 RepID=A0A914PYW4_9BILA
MSLPLMNFSMENITQYCYTTFENTMTTYDSQQKEEGNYCFIQNEVNISRIACCCMKNPHACTPPHKRDDVNSLYCLAEQSDFYDRILAKDYMERYYKPSCTLTITAWMETDENETFIKFRYTYDATDKKCPDDDMVYMCSSKASQPALFKLLYPKCETFFDLRDNEVRNLYIDFNARIFNETR